MNADATFQFICYLTHMFDDFLTRQSLGRLTLLTSITILLAQCSPTASEQKTSEAIAAQLQNLTQEEQSLGKKEVLGEGGLLKKVEDAPIRKEGVEAEWNASTLAADFASSEAFLDAQPQAIGLPNDWEGYAALEIALGSPCPSLEATIYGNRGRLIAAFPNDAPTLRIALQELPLIAGNGDLFTPEKIRLLAHDAARVEIKSIRLLKEDGFNPRIALVDSFGQRMHADWDGKVNHSDALLQQLKSEELNPIPQKNNSATTPFEVTGFIHVEKRGEKWHLVNPEGNPFYSLGINSIRLKKYKVGMTRIDNRPFLFEHLPTEEKYDYAFSPERNYVSFYALNVLRKYGSIDRWASHTLERLQRWGVNTIGNWSDTVLFRTDALAYTHSFKTRRRADLMLNHSLPDVFSDGWIAYIDSIAQKEIAPKKHDRMLLGYFVDNEIHWGDIDVFKEEIGSHYRERWLAYVQSRWDDLSTSKAESWDEVRSIVAKDSAGYPALNQMRHEFQSLVAERYFQIVDSILYKHDPNHMYLGPRFTKNHPIRYVVEACGKHVDILTVNDYSLVPERERYDAWYEAAGERPIMIGEHHLPTFSPHHFPARYEVFPLNRRKQYIINYTKAFAQMPYAVGDHWYQWNDQELTGRGGNGENQAIGVVSITDLPYEDVVEAFGVVSDSALIWKGGMDE